MILCLLIPSSKSKPWPYFVDTYLQDLKTLLLPLLAPESHTNRTTLWQEAEYLQSYLPLEQWSIERFEREKYFAGFTAAQL